MKQTAEEFFRNKLKELHPNREVISLAYEMISAEQGMRWAHEFNQLHLHDVISCAKCGAVEVDAMTPRTVYACGSSDYDQRPNTFNQSEQCRLSVS